MLSPTDPTPTRKAAPRATATRQNNDASISGMLDYLQENYGRHTTDPADWTSPCPICQRPYPPSAPPSNTPPSTTTTTTRTPTAELHTTTPSQNPTYCSPPVMTELCRHVFGSTCYLRYLLSRLPARPPRCPTCRDCTEVPVLGATIVPITHGPKTVTTATVTATATATIYAELYLLDYEPIGRWRYPHGADDATLRRQGAGWIGVLKDMRTMEEIMGPWRAEAARVVEHKGKGDGGGGGDEGYVSEEGEIRDAAGPPPPKAHYLVVIASSALGPRGHRVRDFGVKPWCGGKVYGRVMRRFLEEREREEPRAGDRWQECEVFRGVLGEVFDVGDVGGVGSG